MRFNLLCVLTVLASASTLIFADRMSVNTECPCTNCGACHSSGYFYTDFGSYHVDANKGCRKTGVPGMTEFCVDWDRLRGHFKYSHQDYKRCMVVRSRSPYGCNAHRCERTEWEESGCSWKMIPGNETEPIESTSQVAPLATPTTQEQ